MKGRHLLIALVLSSAAGDTVSQSEKEESPAMEIMWRKLDLRGSICLVHVLESRFVPERGDGEAELIEATRENRARAEKALQEELGARKGAVVLVEGHAAREIDRVANERGAGWIAVGREGRSGLGLALLGSVAEKVARLTRVPVLTVR